MTDSSLVAAEIITELIHLGVTDFVVCPGSRSQALALTVAEAEALGLARLHVRIDERSAAFFALGIARETGRPAPVIVTSGSAVANLMPAALEGFHARIPMVFLTADRPEELRRIRANQTVSDTTYLRSCSRYAAHIETLDAVERGLAGVTDTVQRAYFTSIGGPLIDGLMPSGPAHLNIEFREPLSGGSALNRALEQRALRESVEPTGVWQGNAEQRNSEQGSAGPLTVGREHATYLHGADAVAGDAPLAVVIAGADAGPEAVDFAQEAGIPLFAEPSSGARFGREAIQHYEELLNDRELSGLIEEAIVFGHPTMSRSILALLERDDVRTVVIDPVGETAARRGVERFNPGHRVARFATAASVAPDYDPRMLKPWLGTWVVRDRELRERLTTVHAPDLEAATQTGYKERSEYARAEVARMREPVTREHLTETLWLATWPHDRLVVASSRLIRTLNRTGAPRNIRVHANRGLAGIDGTIATALGIAAASQSHENPRQAAGTTRVLIGDLAFLHDAGSLLLPAGDDELKPRIQLVVGNDGGGSIFDQLEVAATADARAFDRVLYTPHDANLEELAAAYGWSYGRATNRGELERAFTAPVQGPSILEVPLSRK